MASATVSAASGARPRERIAGAFVLVCMAVACAIFWVGIPFGGLWLLGKLTDSGLTHFLLALIAIPLAMAIFALALVWLNGLYLRVTGVSRRMAEDLEQTGWQRRVRGPLEPMLVGCFIVALIALFVWFFVFAENPSTQVI